MTTSFDQTNLEFIKEIKPENIISFLHVNNWKEINKTNDEIDIFQTENNGEKYKVWIPLKSESSDYLAMVFSALNTISQAQQKSVGQLIEDFQTIGVGDVIRFHAYDYYLPEGNTLPFLEGLSLFSRIKQLATAAASSVVDKRPIHSKKPSTEVKEYIDSLRLGQTEKGSYLIKVISPIEQLEKNPGEIDNFTESIPFSRRAVVELFQSVKTLNEVAQTVNKLGKFDFHLFLDAVPKGVSANLCEALLPTQSLEDEYPKDTSLEISVTWSYLVIDDTLPKDAKVFIEKESIPQIRKAAKEFRMHNPESINLQGWVNILERDSRKGPGLIRILGRVHDKIRSVRVNLEPEDYNLAIDAHKNGYIVAVEGDLRLENNIYHLYNPRNLHPIADDFQLFESTK
jgi:hypothetical protein